MKRSIDVRLYEQMYWRVDQLRRTDVCAKRRDMDFIDDDSWLIDTVVIEHIVYRRGMWIMYLVFVDYRDPLRLIRRCISRYYSRRTAEVHGAYMRRQAAKDARGTLRLDTSSFFLPKN